METILGDMIVNWVMIKHYPLKSFEIPIEYSAECLLVMVYLIYLLQTKLIWCLLQTWVKA